MHTHTHTHTYHCHCRVFAVAHIVELQVQITGQISQKVRSARIEHSKFRSTLTFKNSYLRIAHKCAHSFSVKFCLSSSTDTRGSSSSVSSPMLCISKYICISKYTHMRTIKIYIYDIWILHIFRDCPLIPWLYIYNISVCACYFCVHMYIYVHKIDTQLCSRLSTRADLRVCVCVCMCVCVCVVYCTVHEHTKNRCMYTIFVCIVAYTYYFCANQYTYTHARNKRSCL